MAHGDQCLHRRSVRNQSVAPHGSDAGGVLPFALSLIGIALLAVSGWLGGELIYVHGVAVQPHTTASAAMKGRGPVA